LNRLWIGVGSVAVTAVFVTIAFFLGAWAFETRRFLTHETRLQRLVARRPTLVQVVQGLKNEGSPLLAAPRSGDELRRIAEERGRARAAQVVEKGQRWPITRVFQADDMVYFVFFDDGGVMRDYICVAR
jgi:hypothetical protein